MYRRCHILERILTISTTFLMPMVCFEKIVSLLYRCTFVKGSSTLITRCGLLSWISTRLKAGKGTVRGNDVLKLLASRAYDTSDKEWVDDWSNGGVLELLRSFKDGITV